MISAISPAGKLDLAMQETAFDSDGVVAFLKLLLEEITGKLLIIWDGAPIHRSQTSQQFLTDGAAARIWLTRLPGYAPDLNPDEGIWHDLKQVELKNTCCVDLADLRHKLTTATDTLSRKPEIIKGCFTQVDYY